MSNARLAQWLAIALMISVLLNLGTVYYAVQVQQQLTTLKRAQADIERRVQTRQEDLQKEAAGFSRLLGGQQ
jgi:hypothetical protein